MTDRERLLDILRKPIFPHELVDPLEAVADYLLDNGVTFATDTNDGCNREREKANNDYRLWDLPPVGGFHDY